MTTLGLGLGLGSQNVPRNRYILPDLTSSFSDIIATYTKILDQKFGTDPAAPGQAHIPDIATCENYYNAFSNNAGDFVINNEIQRYKAFNADNHHFVADGLNLTATLSDQAGHMPATTKAPTANVSYNRTVPVANASDVIVGQVVGLGADAYDNIHRTRLIRTVGTPANGDTITITFASTITPTPWGPLALTATAGAGSTVSTMASDMVDQINGNATLAAQKVTAYLLPSVPGGFAVTYPKVDPNVTANEFGTGGKYALTSIGLTLTKSSSGITGWQVQENIYFPYVVSKTANSVTLNHPVDLTTASSLTFNSTLALPITLNSSSNATINVQHTTGISAGRICQLGFQDSNILRVVSTTATTVTLHKSVSVPHCVMLMVYCGAGALTNAATSNSPILNFAAVPDWVKEGMTSLNYYASGKRGHIKVVSKTATTVTLSENVSSASGDTWLFMPSVHSGQIWSRFIFEPGADGRKVIAMRLKAKFPNAASIPAFAAWWLYTFVGDPNPIPPVLGNSEIDMIDNFIYANNDSTNNIIHATNNPSSDLYAVPEYTSSNLKGNNLGSKVRDIAMVWEPTRCSFYVDNVLILQKSYTWNAYRRAQMAMNLAVGSVSTSFNSNGFYPIDASQFPMQYKVLQLEMWANPGASALHPST